MLYLSIYIHLCREHLDVIVARLVYETFSYWCMYGAHKAIRSPKEKSMMPLMTG
jgi:hypothetical protein